jgi:hypothetical protein
VIVGADGYSNGQDGEGGAFVFHGSAAGLSTSPEWTAEADQPFASFGASVSAAGDVNGDGFDDVIVGAIYYDKGQSDEGRAFLYHGSAAGLSTSATWTTEGDQVGGNFGRSVGAAGDVNADGFADVIVGANNYEAGQISEGKAFLYHGSLTGPSSIPDWTAERNQAYAGLGSSAGTAGDVNDDGFDDVVVGCWLCDSGQVDDGSAYVFTGSIAGLSTRPTWKAHGDQEFGNLGTSVGTAGDVDADGFDDVIVGASWWDRGQTAEGAAVVYAGRL